MAFIRVVTTRAPGLIPSLIKEIDKASNPVVLIPESFTLACETEIVNRSRDGGIFDLKIFSPSSLIREVRRRTEHDHFPDSASSPGGPAILPGCRGTADPGRKDRRTDRRFHPGQTDARISETVQARQPPHGSKTGRCRTDLA